MTQDAVAWPDGEPDISRHEPGSGSGSGRSSEAPRRDSGERSAVGADVVAVRVGPTSGRAVIRRIEAAHASHPSHASGTMEGPIPPTR